MIVYRIGKTKHAGELAGEGARLNGGRWNHKLVPCIYTSESRALALLEYSANVGIEDIPRALSITSIEIPDKGIFKPAVSDFPGDWSVSPSPASTKDFGSAFLKNTTYPVIRFPSIIIPEEFNYILNPLYNDKKIFRIVNIQDFVFDVRIKKK